MFQCSGTGKTQTFAVENFSNIMVFCFKENVSILTRTALFIFN